MDDSEISEIGGSLGSTSLSVWVYLSSLEMVEKKEKRGHATLQWKHEWLSDAFLSDTVRRRSVV
jgi:hypothetical protein